MFVSVSLAGSRAILRVLVPVSQVCWLSHTTSSFLASRICCSFFRSCSIRRRRVRPPLALLAWFLFDFVPFRVFRPFPPMFGSRSFGPLQDPSLPLEVQDFSSALQVRSLSGVFGYGFHAFLVGAGRGGKTPFLVCPQRRQVSPLVCMAWIRGVWGIVWNRFWMRFPLLCLSAKKR